MLKNLVRAVGVAGKRLAARMWAERHLPPYLKALNAEDFRRAAEQNRDGILLAIFQAALSDHGTDAETVAAQRSWLEALDNEEFLLCLLESISPQHARVLRDFPIWCNNEVKMLRVILRKE